MRKVEYSLTESRLRAAIDLCPIIRAGMTNNRFYQNQATPLVAFVRWVEAQAEKDPDAGELLERLKADSADLSDQPR